MSSLRSQTTLSRFFATYGMLGVLAALCLIYSIATFGPQHRVGEDAADELARKLAESADKGASVLIVAEQSERDETFVEILRQQLSDHGLHVVESVNGTPKAIRATIERVLDRQTPLDVIATPAGSKLKVTHINKDLAKIAREDNDEARLAALQNIAIETPDDYRWPTFLMAGNLLAVANRVVVIAIIAVGMTMVIITGGIDLSVGSLLALSVVLTAKWIVAAGGAETTPAMMLLCCLGAIAVCAAVGAFSGMMITAFRIPPFIATLAVMQIARGLALMITRSQTITGVPTSFKWLGLGTDLWSIPNAVVLMVVVYTAAHFAMSNSRVGRYIYAVGGNREAARLSGIRVNTVLLVAYTVCGAMAGLGGVIEASQFTSGDPKAGMMYELDVIAAVVVGGTSLAGGEGKIFGTLIGAPIIAVIKNGMNITNVEIYTQYVILGLVILAAVLLDTLRKQGFKELLRNVGWR